MCDPIGPGKGLQGDASERPADVGEYRPFQQRRRERECGEGPVGGGDSLERMAEVVDGTEEKGEWWSGVVGGRGSY
jgi:hypothetical protein